ncbi:MAG: DUF5103 domain-containing protein [Bacteroidaceae bacterium]|nr:DUF5103 domain-containing protein [Bacteroidaceae bacterium]
MLKHIITYIALFFAVATNAQFSRSSLPTVRTTRMMLNDEWDLPPVMQLGSDDVLHFSFDEMSHVYHRYTYRIVHCNADWQKSELLEMDYLDGFNGLVIDEWDNSINTTQLYTHYQFRIPNDEVSLKVSGNYRVEVFDDEADEDVPVAVFEFSVVEPLLSFDVKVSGDTDVSFNEGHQQLSIAVGYPSFVASPASELKPVVYQNRRRDNCVMGITPTYVAGDKVEYVHNDRLIFDAGNEFRRFEVADPTSPGEGVEDVIYIEPNYNAVLYMDKPRTSHSNYRDENGLYYVNTFEGYGTVIEADYVNVHFALEVPHREGGNYYLLGDFCGNGFNETNRLLYDYEEGYYFISLPLKLGVYNYMYVWVPLEGGTENLPAEGNFYNTDNEYLVYMYYRGFGDRADRLLGVHQVK